MKSYCLSPIESAPAAVAALDSLLPGQRYPSLLKDTAGDAMAYFEIVGNDTTTGALEIVADVSGRHYNRESEIITVLQKLSEQIGGNISNDA